jgi:hypothetical protein
MVVDDGDDGMYVCVCDSVMVEQWRVRRVCAVVVNAVGGRKHEDYIRVGLMGFSFF